MSIRVWEELGTVSPAVEEIMTAILHTHNVLSKLVNELIAREHADTDNLVLFIIHDVYHEFLANVLTAVDTKNELMKQLAFMTISGDDITEAASKISQMLIKS